MEAYHFMVFLFLLSFSDRQVQRMQLKMESDEQTGNFYFCELQSWRNINRLELLAVYRPNNARKL